MGKSIDVTRELTGEVRFAVRERWFRPALIVLQVQERRTEAQTAWRDASVADLVSGKIEL